MSQDGSSYDCVLPSLFGEGGIDSQFWPFLATDSFILTRNILRLRNCPPPYDTLDPEARYLFLFNRYTHAWSHPIELPEPYRLMWQILEFSPLGFTDEKTFVALCMENESFADRTVRIFLQKFRISDELNAVSPVGERISLAVEHAQGKVCVGFFSSPEKLTLVFDKWSVPEGAEHGTTVVFECSEGATEAEQVHSFGDVYCTHAMVVDGQVYLLCGQDKQEQTLFKCVDGALDYVTEYASFLRDGFHLDNADAGECVCTCGEKLIAAFWCTVRSQIKAAIFDVAECQWTTKTIGYRFPYMFPCWRLSGSLQGEVLSRFYADDEGVSGLLSVWVLPPRLSTLVLRAIHQFLTEEAASRLAQRKDILGPFEVAKFLLDE